MFFFIRVVSSLYRGFLSGFADKTILLCTTSGVAWCREASLQSQRTSVVILIWPLGSLQIQGRPCCGSSNPQQGFCGLMCSPRTHSVTFSGHSVPLHLSIISLHCASIVAAAYCFLVGLLPWLAFHFGFRVYLDLHFWGPSPLGIHFSFLCCPTALSYGTYFCLVM